MTVPVYNSADRLIREAMEDAGLLEEGQDPTTDQSGRYLQRLNDLVNTWQTQGIKLFLIQTYVLQAPILQQGVGIYTFGPTGSIAMPRPLEVVDAFFSDQNGIRRPLLPMSRNDWDRLSQVNTQGQVNQYFADKQLSQLIFNVWNTPDSTTVQGSINIAFRNQVTNFITITDAIVFPIEWYQALHWGLADQLTSGAPDSIIKRCAENAMMYKNMLEAWDVENAPTQFQPDPMGGYRSEFV